MRIFSTAGLKIVGRFVLVFQFGELKYYLSSALADWSPNNIRDGVNKV
jgi:hypothetical protein